MRYEYENLYLKILPKAFGTHLVKTIFEKENKLVHNYHFSLQLKFFKENLVIANQNPKF